MQHCISLALFTMFLINVSQLQKYTQKISEMDAICQPKKYNCSQCIQNPGCKWCKDPAFEFEKRCFHQTNNWICQDWEDPFSSLGNSEKGAKNSSITPSRVHIKLRPGALHKMNVSMVYQDENNRPLDLYILMDLSCTMSVHKERVAILAQDLATNLGKLTGDLRMGFGTFVDKPLMPFSSEKNEKILIMYDPNNTMICNGVHISRTPHLFKNQLSLSSDVNQFTKTVNESKILTNIDVPEGGLDALMQAIVCKDEIKWRYEGNARRVVVLSTDGPFHIAGDGKLGGIIVPHDGKCHLTDGEYDKATTLDYPSISQIRDKIQENNVYVIFAVTNEFKPLYTKLSEKIGRELSSVTVITADDTSVITKVIEEEYQKVVRTVNFQPPIISPYVAVKYFAKCPGSTEFKQQSGCDNLTPNAKVEYKVELALNACPSSLRTTEVAIRPSTFTFKHGSSNFLNITIDMICDCNCEKTKSPPNSKCNNQGFVQCGLCKCDTLWGGQFCNCSVSGKETVDSEGCIYAGNICSNRGDCVCGQCQCEDGFVGPHCQCSAAASCPLDKTDKERCNADLGNGRCTCKGCECNKGFVGDRCQCQTSNEPCKSGQKVCSDYGICECGICMCKSFHHGQFCEMESPIDPNSQTGSCKPYLIEKVDKCVKCLSFEQVNIPKDQRANKCVDECGSETQSKSKISVTLQSKLEERRTSECEGSILDEKECEVRYVIIGQHSETKEIHIRAEEAPNCPIAAPILDIVLSVVGAILIIGILTLVLWKIFTHFHDKREYEKFESERENETWMMNQNPLYKGIVSEFQNPAYSSEESKNPVA